MPGFDPVSSHVQKDRTAARFGLPLWMVAALIGYSVFLFAPQVLNDGDTYSHIATGEWILRHGAVPGTDPFSHTFLGAPWVAHEWLSELAMAVAFRLGGWSGVLILYGGAAALAAGLLARHLARWLDPLPAAIALLLAASCIAPSLLARPHILALPILEFWTAGLLIARERGRVPWLILPLMLVWANLHGSFMFGLVLACPFALEATLAAGKKWRRAASHWALFLAGALTLASVTPQGWHGLAFPVQLLGMKQLGSIGEWRAPDFQTLQPIELALITVLYVCLSRGVRVPVLRLVVLIGLLHLALQHSRHQMLAGVVGALLLAEPLGSTLRAAPIAIRKIDRMRALPAAGFLVLVAVLGTVRIMHPRAPSNGPTSPVSAFNHVPADLAAMPVLNDYAFGGYLIFRGVRPFIDGRADMYGDAFLSAYGEMMRPDRARLEHTLEARGIRWSILAANSPVVAILDVLPDWRRLYADNVAVVFTRVASP